MSLYNLINPPMNRLLSSPWHRLLSKRIMIVAYSGRKSGKRYKIPVSYYRKADAVYCFTNGKWRANFQTERPCALTIRGTQCPARGAIFRGPLSEQTDLMTEYFQAVPQDRKFYGVKCDSDGTPIRNHVEGATRIVDIIEFKLGE